MLSPTNKNKSFKGVLQVNRERFEWLCSDENILILKISTITHLNGFVPEGSAREIVTVNLIGSGVYVNGSHYLGRYTTLCRKKDHIINYRWFTELNLTCVSLHAYILRDTFLKLHWTGTFNKAEDPKSNNLNLPNYYLPKSKPKETFLWSTLSNAFSWSMNNSLTSNFRQINTALYQNPFYVFRNTWILAVMHNHAHTPFVYLKDIQQLLYSMYTVMVGNSVSIISITAPLYCNVPL